MGCDTMTSQNNKTLYSIEELLKYSITEYTEADYLDNEQEMRIHLEYINKIATIINGIKSEYVPGQIFVFPETGDAP